MSDLNAWLQELGLEKYGEILARNDIDLTVVANLTEQDLEQLGFSLGHRRKFMAAAARLGQQAQSTSGAPAASVERRQVTVVFTDLVGSTALGNELDPEDLVDLLRKYRETCMAAIAKHEGFVAQYLGDGILVYFGFPQAHEDAAARAVRAGLEIVEKVRLLKRPDTTPLQARVGIATGLVLVGEADGVGVAGAETVVGETPNLAARLQGLAEPDCVLVGPSTYRLTAEFFDYAPVGSHPIKGFRDPVSVWKALREQASEIRFVAAATGPILGREHELAFLWDAWQRAGQGDGHVVLLEGEPGIGKSRLTEALMERVGSTPHRLLRCQCSPYHRGSALFPFRSLLRQILNLGEGSASEQEDRVRRLLSKAGRHDRASILLLAELLEVATEDKLSPTAMTPNQRRDETLALLVDVLLAPFGGPTLLVLEDAHWSDQSTQTLVERLLNRVSRKQALVVITHRPELKTGWSRHPDATLLACKHVGREQCIALAQSIAGRTLTDPAVLEEIVARSDGVPLFVEELTKAVLELDSAGAKLVPLTLRDSLLARLDRLGGAKEIAQTASVLGRQFSFAALAAVSDTDERALRIALSNLQESGLIFAAGYDGSRFNFKHSLVQEAAYDSLPRGRRKLLHGKIAAYFEAEPVATGESDPTVVAHHYGRAGEAARAARFWLKAADESDRRVALAESVANLVAALGEAERVTDGTLRWQLMLDAQLRLGATLAIQQGAQSNEAELALEKAEAIARECDAGPQLFQANWGLYLNAARNRRFDKARLRGDELLRISRELGDDDLKYEALHHRWGYAYFTGQTAEMLKFTADGVRNYDRDRHHRFSYVFAGHDPGVCAYCVRALALGLAGRAKEVRPALDAGLTLARQLEHPLTVAFFHSVACFAAHVVNDAEGCLEFAEQLVRVSARYDLAVMGAVGSFMTGATQSLRGETTAALKLMRPSFDATLGYGFLGVLPAVIMVDALARASRHSEALALAEHVLDDPSMPETAVFAPELWRLRGELVLHQPTGNSDHALRCLETASRMAEAQGTPIYHLRAAVAAARILAEQGHRDRARATLDRACSHAPADWSGPEIATAVSLRSQVV